METVRNILIDLNGCVVGPEMGPPSKEFYAGLWRLAKIAEITKEQNPPFLMGACTGREMQYARGVLHIIGSPRGFSICESGLGVFDVENEVWIPNPRTNDLEKLFKDELSTAISSIMATHPRELRLYVGNMLHIAIELTKEAKVTIDKLHAEVEHELKEFLAKGIKLHHSKNTEDITAFDKADGVAQIEEKTGISRAETLGIGDSDGDEPLLKTAGFVGCPDNASEECKALVRSKKGHVSPYKYSQGVVDIVQHFTGVKVS